MSTHTVENSSVQAYYATLFTEVELRLLGNYARHLTWAYGSPKRISSCLSGIA